MFMNLIKLKPDHLLVAEKASKMCCNDLPLLQVLQTSTVYYCPCLPRKYLVYYPLSDKHRVAVD